MSSAGDADRVFLEQALALAALGEGTTSPNPRVGCIVARDDEVVGAAFHRAAGSPHAETLAVDRAGEKARGATLYVNLEPCAHEGRTPPCADRIVRAGIRRVVASIADPDPRVDGRGFERMRAAGIEVEIGVHADAAAELNASFLHWHRTGRPFVTLKGALSLDGLLAAREGRSRWITGNAARRFSHRLRYAHDAVLVGSETIRRDDPELTVRLPGVHAPRLRAVLATDLRLDPGARIFFGGLPRPRVYVSSDLPEPAATPFAGRAEVVRVRAVDGRLDPKEVLRDLGAQGVRSLLVEGGGATLGSFLAAGLADRAFLFVAKRLLGARGATPLLDLPTAEDPAHGFALAERGRLPLGDDWLLWGRIESRCSPD